MTCIGIAEKKEAVLKILERLASAENIECVLESIKNEIPNDRIEILIVSDCDSEINMRLFKKAAILITDKESVVNIKDIPAKTEVVICGSNEKDSFTFSSINENDIIVVVQRNIRNIHGEVIYPCEFKISADKYGLDSFSNESLLLACCGYLCAVPAAAYSSVTAYEKMGKIHTNKLL